MVNSGTNCEEDNVVSQPKVSQAALAISWHMEQQAAKQVLWCACHWRGIVTQRGCNREPKPVCCQSRPVRCGRPEREAAQLGQEVLSASGAYRYRRQQRCHLRCRSAAQGVHACL